MGLRAIASTFDSFQRVGVDRLVAYKLEFKCRWYKSSVNSSGVGLRQSSDNGVSSFLVSRLAQARYRPWSIWISGRVLQLLNLDSPRRIKSFTTVKKRNIYPLPWVILVAFVGRIWLPNALHRNCVQISAGHKK